jgi:hypothetical protein
MNVKVVFIILFCTFNWVMGQMTVKNADDLVLFKVTEAGNVAIGSSRSDSRLILSGFSTSNIVYAPPPSPSGVPQTLTSLFMDNHNNIPESEQNDYVGLESHVAKMNSDGQTGSRVAVHAALVDAYHQNWISEGSLALQDNTSDQISGVSGVINPLSVFPTGTQRAVAGFFQNEGSSSIDYTIYARGTKNYFQGSVGIGNESFDHQLYKLYIEGDVYCSGSYLPASDIRFKKNIHNIENALDKIMQLNGVHFNWRHQEFPQKGFNQSDQVGLIAQQVESILPELVRTDKYGYKALDYDKLAAYLVEAVKTLREKNIELANKVNELLKDKE